MRSISSVLLLGLQLLMWGFPLELRGLSDYRDTTKIDLAALERDLLTEVNRVRVDHGLPAYEFSERLWYTAKNDSRRMALEQKPSAVDLKGLVEARAGADPISFWAGASHQVARVPTVGALAHVVQDWAKDKDLHSALWSRPYNRAAIGISVDRAGALYAVLLSGEQVYQESNLRRLEQMVFDVVNALRTQKGLRSLQLSQPLSKVARGHSESMAVGYYFGHTDLKGMDVSQRLLLHKIPWQACAENLASNHGRREPVKTAVDGWLTSRPHAAAMLREDFTHTGVGIAKSLDETYYFTQVFIK